MESKLSKVIQFPQRKRAKKMKSYKVYMTEEYVIHIQADDEQEAADEAAKIIGDCPGDYCLGGSIQVERID
jgi:hypothetical protein